MHGFYKNKPSPETRDSDAIRSVIMEALMVLGINDVDPNCRTLDAAEVMLTRIKNTQIQNPICAACECPIDADGCGCNPHDA